MSGEEGGVESEDMDLWSESDEDSEAGEMLDELVGLQATVCMSGALYESILVVDRSSSGEEILSRTLPIGTLVVVRDLPRDSAASSFFARFLVKARASDMLAD